MHPFRDFDGRDPALLARAERCRQTLARANGDPTLTLEARQALVTALLASVGETAWLETPFTCEFGHNLSIGARTFVNRHCQFHDTDTIMIGSDVLVGPGVQVCTASHPVHPDDRVRATGRAPYHTRVAPVNIGNRVWLGAGVIVCPGVTIGEGSTIGAGSIVTQDIPPMVVAAGQPCRVIRSLDDSDRG